MVRDSDGVAGDAGRVRTGTSGAEAQSAPSTSANDLPFEQRSAIWTLYYASQAERRKVLARRVESPGAPGSNAEVAFSLTSLKGTNSRAMSLHALSKAGLRRGLDDLVRDGLALHETFRTQHLWKLTKLGRNLVGEPRT